MHPILARRGRLALYLVVFLQAGLLLGELIARGVGDPNVPQRTLGMALALPLMLVHAFTCLASWYLCRSLPLGATRGERLAVSLLAAALLAAGLTLLVGLLWAGALGRWIAAAPAVFEDNLSIVFAFAFFLFSLAVAVHYLFAALADSRAAEARALELRLLAQEAELRALKAQIDPHFLFNSLNSISALVASDPARARAMCQRLAGFLRRSLRLMAADSIALAEEIEHVRDYLEIERIRFGDRLAVSCRVDADCAARPVPPLILQPLVENAVRHGIGGLLEGGTVTLSAEPLGSGVRLRVENPVDPESSKRGGDGIGLSNVRRRLQVAYGGAARLHLDAAAERYVADIELPGAG